MATQPHRQPSSPPIAAPYNFVPLGSKIVQPEWAELVSHDWPFKDGVSGTLDYTLTAHSPILVAGPQTQGQPKSFYSIGNSQHDYAIHGATLKGMIRSVLEIASFSRMTLVEDTRYAVRDLTPQARLFYGDKLTESVGDKRYRARPQAGWLFFDQKTDPNEPRWRIQPCAYSRVEHDDLAAFVSDNWWRSVPRVSAKQKYEHWGTRSLAIRFDPGQVQWHNHSDGKQLEYSRATNLGRGATDGMLVFTGQPAARPNKPEKRKGKKHLEFVFHSPASAHLDVSPSVMSDFLEIHKPRPEFGYAGEEWDYWVRKPRIPVFYLPDAAGKVASLGLALMFKLPYKKSVHDAIPKMHREGENDRPDFATLIFGYSGEDVAGRALKGRAWFETAVAVAGTTENSEPIRTVLNSPKPSYYPNYIRQATNKATNPKTPYRTFMDDQAEIRGWKRYPARPRLSPATPGADGVTQTLNPLAAGAQFKGRLVFHNLRPAELGALIWSLTWGGRSDLRHSIGSGKPLGMGQVSIALDRAELQPNDGSEGQALSAYQKKFSEYMNSQVEHWAKSDQIKALCGMASPGKAAAFKGKLENMSLGDGPQSNQFQNAKKNRLVLAEYPGLEWTPQSAASARPDDPVEWKAVRLQFNKGNGEITANGPNGARGITNRDQAKALIDALPEAAKGVLKNNRLVADIQVEYIGGKNWCITHITPRS